MATPPTGLLSTLVTGVITLFFVIGTIIFFFMLAFGAIQWISSGGDKQALESARGRMTSALVGYFCCLPRTQS